MLELHATIKKVFKETEFCSFVWYLPEPNGHILCWISWLLDYVTAGRTELLPGRFLMPGLCWQWFTKEASFPQCILHVSIKTRVWKAYWSRGCRRVTGFNCASGEVVAHPSPKGKRAASVLGEDKESKRRFFVMELSNLSYSFYIWFSGTEGSEERNLKQTWIWNWAFN